MSIIDFDVFPSVYLAPVCFWREIRDKATKSLPIFQRSAIILSNKRVHDECDSSSHVTVPFSIQSKLNLWYYGVLNQKRDLKQRFLWAVILFFLKLWRINDIRTYFFDSVIDVAVLCWRFSHHHAIISCSSLSGFQVH